jgi:hypothetical protein
MQESALLQKVARHVDLQTPGVHRAARLKEEDGHHQRHGQRACVKAPSHELAHVSATEGTERGRRGGMGSAWVALNEVRRPVCRIPFLLRYWACNTSGVAEAFRHDMFVHYYGGLP